MIKHCRLRQRFLFSWAAKFWLVQTHFTQTAILVNATTTTTPGAPIVTYYNYVKAKSYNYVWIQQFVVYLCCVVDCC